MFFITSILAGMIDWKELYVNSAIEVCLTILGHLFTDSINPKLENLETLYTLLQMASFCLILTFIGVFISAIKLLLVNKHHVFPLKRIAISSMILIPIGMMANLGEWITGDIENGFLPNAILMLPYLFLFHHFYRAEMEDKTV